MTRWTTGTPADHSHQYVRRMRRLAADGGDLAGEARLVDALVGRRARVLDAGCGTGRVGAALHARGHDVVGLDADPVLIEAAREDHDGPAWLVGDLATVDAASLGGPVDAVVLAGNVMVFLVPGSEAQVLGALRGVLAPAGVLVAGFATDRDYRVADFDRDCANTGLVVEHRFATWDLRPWRDDAEWAVTVARRA